MEAAGDPERAVQQQRYMKSPMPYHGLAAPEVRALLRPHLHGFAPADRADWERTVRALWDDATHREEWYAAIAFARHRTARSWQDVETLDLYRHMVTTGAWWDVVDADVDLLTFAIERNLVDPSFWLRKAIGWALRQHARVDPDWVRAYVDSLGDRLSSLSRREATKHLRTSLQLPS
jgi:3-methyladenine DNA glycosylase AlkD